MIDVARRALCDFIHSIAHPVFRSVFSVICLELAKHLLQLLTLTSEQAMHVNRYYRDHSIFWRKA